MTNGLTDKQQAILDYIKEQILSRGIPPTVRDICEAVNLKSTSSVHAHLQTLEEKGFIRREGNKSRTIEITDDEFNLSRREVVNVPVIGTITAGQPILAVQNIEDYFPIPVEMMPNEQSFILKVKGSSMINAGIFNGDYIIVKQQNTAYNGDYVVALIDDSVTVKTFYKESNCIRLQPENDSMEPMYFDSVNILGKVIGVFRMF